MNGKELKVLRTIFISYPEIKLVYFFGSRAKGREGPRSDYDFAFYLDVQNRQRCSEIRFSLMDKISRLLKADALDIVILNMTDSPELKYQIIKEGRLIYEIEPFRIIVEPRILTEYFDFRHLLLRYHLTRA